MNEKKFTYILFSVAALAILIVILVNIPWGGDKSAIMKEFDSLESRDHVFETISYDKVIEKINSGETFQLFVGSSALKESNVFVFEANKLAKQYGLKTIYYLNYSKLTANQLDEIKILSSVSTTFPTLIYFEDDEGSATSTAFNISGLKDLDNFDHNWKDLLSEYFSQCYDK